MAGGNRNRNKSTSAAHIFRPRWGFLLDSLSTRHQVVRPVALPPRPLAAPSQGHPQHNLERLLGSTGYLALWSQGSPPRASHRPQVPRPQPEPLRSYSLMEDVDPESFGVGIEFMRPGNDRQTGRRAHTRNRSDASPSLASRTSIPSASTPPPRYERYERDVPDNVSCMSLGSAFDAPAPAYAA